VFSILVTLSQTFLLPLSASHSENLKNREQLDRVPFTSKPRFAALLFSIFLFSAERYILNLL